MGRQIVIAEIEQGDSEAVEKRKKPLIEVVTISQLPNEKVLTQQLSQDLMQNVPIPAKAAADAFHVAIASVQKMDYLLTWNCRHIANATLRHKIEEVCQSHRFKSPILCTPEQLMPEQLMEVTND